MVTSLHIPVALLQSTAPAWNADETVGAIVGLLVGAAVGFAVYRFARRTPWPRPFRLGFGLAQLVAAVVAIALWMLASAVIVSLVMTTPLRVPYWESRALIGFVLYIIVAGGTYVIESSARAARAESLAARTQLAALRAQIHPHFLFNALHTVVQLIPVDQERAVAAAELLADLLRTSLEAERDEVTLAEEWRFVSLYLDLERIRFGDRLVVASDMDSTLLRECVPAFALQTLVENAVQHGAAPRAEPTEISVTATRDMSALTLTVRNAVPQPMDAGADGGAPRRGTGLARLRERLDVLHGGSARLVTNSGVGVFDAVLTVPLHEPHR